MLAVQRRERVDVGHRVGQPEERRGPVALRLVRSDELEDHLAEAEERLPSFEAVLLRIDVAGAQRVEADGVERGDRAVDVGRHDHEVVDQLGAVGVRNR